MTRMWKSNLLCALRDAITVNRQQENEKGYTSDSIYVAGLVEVFEALQNGERVEIRYDENR